jgi:uncharacterized membrane protein
MKTGRLEAFSDGVLAIIITIMVLELKAPHHTNFEAIIEKTPTFLSYLVSFIYIGIYWNNHHHLFQITEKVNGKILWANLHLLFWLSLIPFATSWIGENHFEAIPVALYGFVLLMSGIAFLILKSSILTHHDKYSLVNKSLSDNKKELFSLGIYLVGLLLAFVNPYIAISCFVAVQLMWFIPDKRIEKNV